MSKSTAVTDTERPQGTLEVDLELAENIAALLEDGERGMVLNLVADLYPADLSMLLSHLPYERARELFRWLSPGRAGLVLAELDDTLRSSMLEQVRPHEVADLLDALDTDDAADVLADLPDDVALRVLPSLEDSDDVQQLLGYDEESAGGIMAAEYVAVPSMMSVVDVTEVVRQNTEIVEEVFSIFVIDEEGLLRGIVPLKRLLLSPAGARIIDIADTDFVSVTTDLDQEEVAHIMQRYDLVSLPVVEQDGRLAGRITIDDVVDVIRDEAEEDIQLMSGLGGTEEPYDSIFHISRGRLPWLVVGLTGAGLSGMVIGQFEESLEQAVVLASFIPIVTAMGGNAAVQSAAITVQGLTSGELWPGEGVWRLAKEVAVALVNGLALAAMISLFVLIIGLGSNLALTVGLTMLMVIVLATANGALIPFVLQRAGADPASAMGPFVTTLNDIIGLMVYFTVANVTYL